MGRPCCFKFQGKAMKAAEQELVSKHELVGYSTLSLGNL